MSQSAYKMVTSVWYPGQMYMRLLGLEVPVGGTEDA